MVDKCDILLVNPACQDERVTDDDARQVPIGLYYIAAELMANGLGAFILNLAGAEGDPLTEFETCIRKIQPDIIGFSVTNPSRMNAMACAERSKELLPEAPVVFGGPAPTFLYDHLMKTCPAIDFIVLGEGEITFLELVRAVKKQGETYPQIKGLVYRGSRRIEKTGPRELIQDLDALARPSDYFAVSHLSMSRGCPGKCTFCGSPKFWPGGQVRFHSPQWMARELITHAGNGVTHFFFSDDTFTMDKPRVIELCRLIREETQKNNLSVTWNAISRADAIDEDILRAMRTAGCIQISYGVESGSALIRKRLGKPIDQDRIIQAFRQTLSYGILPRAYFIYGSPGETDETIQESIDLIHRISPLSAVFYMLVLFPGTHLYSRAKQKGWVTDDFWEKKIEDLPWFELDDRLDFQTVKRFGNRLRYEFHSGLSQYARGIELKNDPALYQFHADFLSRLAMTFSHGEYAADSRVRDAEATAQALYERALTYAPDARAYLGLGMLLQKQRQFEQAIDMLNQGLTHFNDHRDLSTCMGVCLMNTGNFKAALPIFEAQPPSPEADHYIRICRKHL